MHGIKCIEYPKKQCFACKGGKCAILTSTDFAGGSCVFYKSPGKALNDLKKYGGIMVYKNGEYVQTDKLERR